MKELRTVLHKELLPERSGLESHISKNSLLHFHLFIAHNGHTLGNSM